MFDHVTQPGIFDDAFRVVAVHGDIDPLVKSLMASEPEVMPAEMLQVPGGSQCRFFTALPVVAIQI